MELIVLWLLFTAAVSMYLLPAGVALMRDHHLRGPIIVVNVLFGWTLIGWGVALAMASGRVKTA